MPEKTGMQISHLYAGYGSEQILHIDELHFSENKVTGLLGPSGTGKSTLLKIIARLDEFDPTLWSEGSISYQKHNLLDETKIDWVRSNFLMLRQKSRFYGGKVIECILSNIVDFEQITQKEAHNLCKKILSKLDLWDLYESNIDRPVLELSLGFHKLIMIAKLLYNKPIYLILDEPFRDFAIVEEPILIDVIAKLKKFVGVVMVTHNKLYAQKVCDDVALISSGRLIETASCHDFFTAPKTKLGKMYLKSGSAWDDDDSNDIESDVDVIENFSDKTKLKKQFPRLSSFYWIVPGQIGGTQKPGLLSDEAEDIRRLNAIHVDYLISLTQQKINLDKYKDNNIEGVHFPIVDMDIPELKPVHDFFNWLTPHLKNGKSAIFHCKAGIGRTGTMLACNLVFMGMTAAQAIEKVRTVFYQYIQTEAQLQFVYDYENYVKAQ